MPLSDHEKRVLDEIENDLDAADPKLSWRLDGTFSGAGAGRRAKAAALIGCGLTMVIVAITLVSTSTPALLALSVLGFLVMLAGAVYATSGPSPSRTPRDRESGPPRNV